MGTTLGERMGSKDEPQLSPLGGALGRQEKLWAMSFLSLLSSSRERANCGGFISSNVRDPIRERGEELDVRARALPKQLPLRVPQSTGLSPDANSTNRAFQKHPKTALTSCRHLVGRGNPSSPGKAGERRVLLGGKSEQGEARGGGRFCVVALSPLCQRGTKQARSRELPSALGSRLANGLRIDFLFTQ